MADTKNIRGIELGVYAKKEPDQKGRSWRLRLVQWVIDGVAKSVKLEKRTFYIDEYGKEMTGKCEGMLLQDLEALKPHWTKIMELMRNPPAVAPEAAKTDEEIEEVPF